MPKEHARYRWFVVFVFFCFMLLHQTDKLMIGSLQLPISGTFGLDDFQWGLVNSGALLVATLLYPIWGYLNDRYSRAKLLSLASLIWGATTWLSSIVKTYPQFLGTRASTGVDDSSYPGMYSLVADYFGPGLRSKVYGLLQLAQPIGYLAGMILALMVAPMIGGWRSVFYITGSLGLVIALLIYFGVQELPRGKAEPEFEGMAEVAKFEFSWKAAGQIVQKRTMWFIFLQGFAGVFPWNVITYFFFAYLQVDRNYTNDEVLFTMAPVILIMAAGYFVGGYLGDLLFTRTRKGRILVSSAGVLFGAIFLALALLTPIEEKTTFFVLMCATALFMPFSSPNVVSTVFDVTSPDVRSTAQSVEYFVENIGAVAAPLLAGAIAVATSKQFAILSVCTITWGLCFIIYLGALRFVEGDIQSLRDEMAARAALDQSRRPA
jgi:MFS family permease